jgi:three-Cys-motif partner protein
MAQLPFGGTHTEEKLRVLEKYLSAYQKVLKNKQFTTVFFAAFAGTGDIPIEESGGLFEDVEDAQPFIDGSARRALGINPPFDRYVFVEKSKSKAALLETLKRDFVYVASRIHVQRADANEAIEKFCQNTDWKLTRAVMFLDPFGNQVDWSTIAVIAATKANDLWYLFPAHLGINRQISASGEFDAAKAASLDRVLGTGEWRNQFIATKTDQNLWGEDQTTSFKQANADLVTRFMIRRMKEVFRGVVLDEWLPLGRAGSHWYSLLFACANPSSKATDVAGRIARAVMKRK